MIIKNHTIELKDTSASEMARFRQIMLGIWRQQIEDDKNTDEMIKYASTSNINNSTNLVSLSKIIESIKNKIGEVHEHMFFHDLVDIPNSIPDGFEEFTYDDSQGNVKQAGILLKSNQFKGINLIANTFQAFIEIGSEQTDFILTIFNNDLTQTAFKFTVHDFDLFMALFKSLGIKYSDTGNKAVIDLYIKKIKDAKNDPNQLDVIYQSYPKILFGKMDDSDLYKHLDLILNDMYLLGGSVGTNEDKAVLQILYAIKDRQSLYIILRDSDLLCNIYRKLQGDELQDLLRFVTHLVAEFDNSKPTDTVYFDNSYYLFRDTHIKTAWSGNNILIDNCKKTDKTETIGKARASISAKDLDRINPPGVYEVPVFEHYIEWKPFNPLAKLNFGTKLGDLGDQIGDENTFVIALKLHNMATKQSNWDLFNIATDLLSLLSAVGALRIVLAKGAPMTARALAGIVLAKDATHYAMLSNGTLEKWHKNGYGWLANLWIAFSVTADLASFGLPNLSKMAKEGNAAAELAETAKDAKETRKVIEEANKIVEVQTGKDVSKMTEKQFEKFVKQTMIDNRKIITLADINQLGIANKIQLVDESGENVAYITRNMRYGAKKGITYEFNALREAGTIKKGSKTDLKCEMKLLDSESAKKYDLTVKQNEEILYLDFNIPPKINEQYSGLGQIIFDDAHTFMKNSKKVPEISGMFGVWIKYPAYYAHYGGESINLKKFLKAIDSGMDEKKAAFETITGGWAKDNGYTKVEFQKEWSREEVIVKFLKE
ncbi:hypothetical protein ACQKCJ_16440 [Flavobacterium sp. NPDC079362]|uniref:hypothetical protein n=1 Tax=Flavobacterium sp. NPDC079362 TaxID=3390566 RepID=UPI003D0147A7